MLTRLLNPKKIKKNDLDTFWELGWYRMEKSIFTTNFLKFREIFYSAIWLRITLENFKLTKTQIKIKKINAGFRAEIKPHQFSQSQDLLYQKYRASIQFEASPSNRDILGDCKEDLFYTLDFNVFDGEKLIACGYLDLGKTASAGISCFYDPDYKQYSLGKYLMVLKMEYSKALGLKYFYPGYFAPNYPLFDYKLQLNKPNLEYFNVTTNIWHSFQEFDYEQIPLEIMHQELKKMAELLEQSKISHKLYFYEFFAAEMMPSLNGQALLDFPIFIEIFPKSNTIQQTIVVFDIRDQLFKVFECIRCFFSNDCSCN